MIIRLFFVFVFLFVAIFLGVQLKQDPGYVLITIRSWSIEMTFWVAALFLVLGFLLLHFLLLLLQNLGQLPQRFCGWRHGRQVKKAQKCTQKGLIEYSEGLWSGAKNHLVKALPNAEAPLLNYLIAAKCAQKLGDFPLRDQYLRDAKLANPSAKIAIKLTEVELQLANKQWEQALVTLEQLRELAPHHPYVLRLFLQLYEAIPDWQALIGFLPELKKQRLLEKRDFTALRLRAYQEELKLRIGLNEEDSVAKFMQELPKDLKHGPEIVSLYGQFLLKNQKLIEAEAVLKRALQQGFHDKLIALYGQFYLNEKQRAFAESLIKKAPDSAALYLCLGHLALSNRLWGKAKNYFEKSLALKETPEVCQELGSLYEQLGETNKALAIYRQGLVYCH